MSKEYQLAIKTVRRSEFADEYEGREGLTKLPYKMLLQQSEVRNGQLQSEIDELNDLVDTLKARIAELEAEIEPLKGGLLMQVKLILHIVSAEDIAKRQENVVKDVVKDVVKELTERQVVIVGLIA